MRIVKDSLITLRHISSRRMLGSLLTAAKLALQTKLRFTRRHCPLCRASVVSMSSAAVIRQQCADLAKLHVYELSARGPLFEFLRRNVVRARKGGVSP